MLATEATALIHGRANADAAAETAALTFEQGALATDLPSIAITRAELDGGIGVLAAFVKAGLVKSNGEARRQIQGGGLRVNDAAVTDEKAALSAARSDCRRRRSSCRSARRSTCCCGRSDRQSSKTAAAYRTCEETTNGAEAPFAYPAFQMQEDSCAPVTCRCRWPSHRQHRRDRIQHPMR